MGRTMALDIGKRRIGVALGDPTGIVASPLEVLEWGRGCRELPDREAVLRRLREMIACHEVDCLVVGVPRSMGGGMGPQGEYVMEWVDFLETGLDVTVVTQDERLSTAGARRALLEGNVDRRTRRGLVDKMAAALILETYLGRVRREDEGCSEEGERRER